MPKSDYKEMLAYVKKQLESTDPNAGSRLIKINYSRYHHIKRVYSWMLRILKELNPDINVEESALHIATIFHDSGYGILEDRKQHAQSSALICRRYLEDQEYEEDFIARVEFLVANHSRKELMQDSNMPIELIILMEADLLDDIGALGITMDIMIEAIREGVVYPDILEHINNYSLREIRMEPMVTEPAKRFWREKQMLTEEFVRQFSRDIGLDE